MTVNSLNIYCKEISRATSTVYLMAIRAKLQGLLKQNDISIGMYQNLNSDIRDRADWIMSRKENK